MIIRNPDSATELKAHHHQHGGTPKRSWQARAVFWLFIGIAAFYLISEHRAHLLAGFSWLPFLLLLACPFMHMFMHGGHGGHRSGDDADTTGGTKPPSPTANASVDSKADRPHAQGGDQS